MLFILQPLREGNGGQDWMIASWQEADRLNEMCVAAGAAGLVDVQADS